MQKFERWGKISDFSVYFRLLLPRLPLEGQIAPGARGGQACSDWLPGALGEEFRRQVGTGLEPLVEILLSNQDFVICLTASKQGRTL